MNEVAHKNRKRGETEVGSSSARNTSRSCTSFISNFQTSGMEEGKNDGKSQQSAFSSPM